MRSEQRENAHAGTCIAISPHRCRCFTSATSPVNNNNYTLHFACLIDARRYFECNYGEATLPLDWLFGTFRDGLPEGQGSGLQGVEHGKAQ